MVAGSRSYWTGFSEVLEISYTPTVIPPGNKNPV